MSREEATKWRGCDHHLLDATKFLVYVKMNEWTARAETGRLTDDKKISSLPPSFESFMRSLLDFPDGDLLCGKY